VAAFDSAEIDTSFRLPRISLCLGSGSRNWVAVPLFGRTYMGRNPFVVPRQERAYSFGGFNSRDLSLG
jgi:hypothetical protein